MVKPNDEHEQLQSMAFQAQHTIAVFVQTTEYGSIGKEIEVAPYNTVQGLENVPQANDDCTNLREFLLNYNIVSEENIYSLANPDKEQMVKLFGGIKERLKDGMEATHRENYTLIVVIAGQSIVIKGENWYVLNIFDEATTYYEKVTIELLLKDIAKEFPNTYVIGLFSCMSQSLHKSDMEGFQDTSGVCDDPEADRERPIHSLHKQKKIINAIEEQVQRELSGIRPDIQIVTASEQERFNQVKAVEENFVLMYGGLQQNLHNKQKKAHFILTLIDTMKNKIDPRKLVIQIPQVFKSMQTLDASIELATSKTYQTLNLSMCSQVIINSLAIIFVTSNKYSEGWEDQGAKAVSLFENVLRFKKVEVCRDYTKRQIIDKLAEVKKFADHHEEMNKGDEGDLVIAINWCGPSFSIANKNFKIQSHTQKQNENAKFEFQLYLARPLNGKDGSKFCQHYELTFKREPICINEYACQISEGPSTLVIQFNQDCEPERAQWMIESIIKTKNNIKYLERVFHSKVLKSRPGRKQFSFFPNVKMNELFDCCSKQAKVQNMYIVPYLLDKSTKYESIRRHHWVNGQNKIIEPLQATLDSRTEEQKKIDATPDQKYTFATQINIWQEAPQLIQSKVASKHWRTSLHHLHKLELILYTTVIETNEINFTFLMNRPPYSIVQDLKHPKEGYVTAMYPIDRRNKESQNRDQNMLIAILIGHDGHLQEKKLVKFVRDPETEKWSVEKEKAVTGGKHMVSEIRNCSLLDNGEIMLVTSHVYIMYNLQFRQLKVTFFNKSALTWAPNPVVSCFVPEYSKTHNNGFLVAFLEVDKENMNVYKASEQNFNLKYAKLLRCQYNSIRDKLEAPKYETDSILVENQYINQVLEFAPNRIIMVLDMTILLILKDWKVVQSMEDPGHQGRRGLWMCPMPFFNTDSFPFILSSGQESINLINVKTYTIECLIKQAATSISAGWQGSKGQAAGFFKIEESNCEFTLHFSTRSHASNGRLARWHAMTFRRDFKEWLEDYGCLPSTFYAKHANDVQRRKSQMRMIGEKMRQMVRERMTTNQSDQSTRSVMNKQTFSDALIGVSQFENPKKEVKKVKKAKREHSLFFEGADQKNKPRKVQSRPDSASPGQRLKPVMRNHTPPDSATAGKRQKPVMRNEAPMLRTQVDKTPERFSPAVAQTLSDEIISELRTHFPGNPEFQTKLNNLVSIMEQNKRRKDEQEEVLKVVHDTQEGLMYQYHEQQARIIKLEKMQQQQKDKLKQKEVQVSHLVAEKSELDNALAEMTKQYEDLKPVQKLADVLTEHNKNLEEQLAEKQKIASGVNQKEREAKEALMQREIMAQALTKKEIERAKTSSTREEMAAILVDTQKDLDVARKKKYEQNRRVRELEVINKEKEKQLQLQSQTIILQKQLLEEQKKQNIAVKFFNPLAPYTAWNEFMPSSPSKLMMKDAEAEQVAENEKKYSQPRPTPFQSRLQTMMGSPRRSISPLNDAVTQQKRLSVAKLVQSEHTRQRNTMGRKNKSVQLLENFTKSQDNWRKLRRPTTQSVTYEEKEKEAYELKQIQPLPKPQSIVEIIKFSNIELYNSLQEQYIDQTPDSESYRQHINNINQDSDRSSQFQRRKGSNDYQIKKKIRSKYNSSSITVAQNARKSNMQRKLVQVVENEKPGMTDAGMSPMENTGDTIYIIKKQKQDE